MQSCVSLGELIAGHPFLVGLDPRFQRFFEASASLRRFSSRQRIFQEGGEADHFYLILSGTVILETLLPRGAALSIQTLRAGEALGWSWLFPPYQWSFSAVTSAPTEVISCGAGLLRETATRDIEFANELLRRIARTVVQRLHVTHKELVDLSASINATRSCETSSVEY